MNNKYLLISSVLNEIKAINAIKFGAAGLPAIGITSTVPAALYKSHKFNKLKKEKSKKSK
jgi:hypothetical protein